MYAMRTYFFKHSKIKILFKILQSVEQTIYFV